MNVKNTTGPLVSASLIARYLQSLAWKRKVFKNGLIQLTPDNNDVEVFFSVGTNKQQRQEESVMALRTIADFYDTTIEMVQTKVLSYLSDRISNRIPDEYVRNDTIEYRVASEYLVGMRTFLSTSAATEISGKLHFERTLKEASIYADQCRFGHTFRGSFGFVVASPVESNDNPVFDGLEQALPLGRRVIERIARGLHSIDEASEIEDPDCIVKAVKGFSANMCTALADLLEKTEVSRMDFGIDFSSEWKSSLATTDPVNFEIESSNIELLRVAAKRMTADAEPSREAIFGRVRSVSTDGNPSDLNDAEPKREVEINWVSKEEKLVHVKLKVSPSDYLTAVEAHRSGRPVSVSGMLPPSGKTRWLTEVSELKVIDL